MLGGHGSYVQPICDDSFNRSIFRPFKVSLAQSAATGSIFSVGFAIGCLLFGAISDKYGRKK